MFSHSSNSHDTVQQVTFSPKFSKINQFPHLMQTVSNFMQIRPYLFLETHGIALCNCWTLKSGKRNYKVHAHSTNVMIGKMLCVSFSSFIVFIRKNSLKLTINITLGRIDLLKCAVAHGMHALT